MNIVFNYNNYTIRDSCGATCQSYSCHTLNVFLQQRQLKLTDLFIEHTIKSQFFYQELGFSVCVWPSFHFILFGVPCLRIYKHIYKRCIFKSSCTKLLLFCCVEYSFENLSSLCQTNTLLLLLMSAWMNYRVWNQSYSSKGVTCSVVYILTNDLNPRIIQ